MTTKSTDEIRARIEKFAQELDLLVRRQTLDALKAVLSGDSSTPRAAAATPARTRGRRGRRGAAPSPETTAKLLEIITGSAEGVSVSELATALGMSSKDLRKPLLALIAEKQIHTTGQRRGMRYHGGAGGSSGKARRKA